MIIGIDNLADKDLFEEDEASSVTAIEALNCDARAKWEHEDFKAIYKRIKKELLVEQKKHCFYCQKKYLNISMDDWHIDHIVPIDEDSRFLFCDRNFVVACKWCNRVKNDKPVFVARPKSRKYSKSSKNFRIVHARYDLYSSNIDILAGQIYIGKTSKGRRTVHDLGLERFMLEFLSNISSYDRDFIEGAMQLLLSGDPRQLIGFIKSLP